MVERESRMQETYRSNIFSWWLAGSSSARALAAGKTDLFNAYR